MTRPTRGNWLIGMLWLGVLLMPLAASAADPNPAAQATCTTDDGATCVIRGRHELPAGTILDYGDRDVVLHGHLTLAPGPGPRSLMVRTRADLRVTAGGRIGTENRAHQGRDGGDLTLEVGGSLTLHGRVDLDGHPSQGTGGTLALTTGGPLTLSHEGAILAEGRTGGTLALTVGGDLTLAGRVKARGHPSYGQGGTVTLTVGGATTLTVPGRLRVDGATAGRLALHATGPLTLDGDLTANGKQGGTITLEATGPVTLGPQALLTVAGEGRAGRAGTLTASFCGPGALLAGRLQAVGEGGADGGTLTLQSRGPLIVAGRLTAEGEGQGAQGGTIALAATAGLTFGRHARLNAEGRPDGTITLAAPDPLETAGLRSDPPVRRVALPTICGLSPLQVARANHTATLLRDGTVLLAGGRNGSGPVDSLEQFNPAIGTFSGLVSRLSTLREAHSSTVLPDGKILLLGGSDGTRTLDTADLFDPASGSITALPACCAAGRGSPLLTPRAGHTATLLLDGTVLITGGTDGTQVLDTALVFDPASGSVLALGSRLSTLRSGHTATLLPDGRVLLTGGTSNGSNVLDSAELFNPATQSFSALPARLSAPRSGHTATLLPDGTVLLLGGTSDGTTALASGEFFDPAPQSFAALSSLLRARREHTATLLGDGSLLVTGGFGSSPLGTAERLSLGLPDATPPTVVAVRPPDQATDVAAESRVAVRFSEPIRPSTLTPASFTLSGPAGPVEALIGIGESGLLAFLTPADSLVAGVTYTVQLTSEVVDTSGNPLVPVSSTFTIQGATLPLVLLPNPLSLLEGQTASLTIQLPSGAPAGGLTVTLESAAPGIASVPASVPVLAGATSATAPVIGSAEGTTNLTATAPGFASGQSAVTVVPPVPSLTGFSPTSGKVATTVTLTGTGFRPSPDANTVRFTGANSTWVVAAVTAATSTSLTVAVPEGATTGPIRITTSGGTATSSGHFIVLPTLDFTLAVAPTTVTAIPGTSVSLKVSTVTTGGYTGLTQLGTGSLPSGVTATFTPPFLGPNASGLLTLTTLGSTPSASSIEVRGTATIEGTVTTRTATATLSVQGPGQTVLMGQVLDENEKPVPGVSIELGGSTLTTLGTTDAAGNFLVPLAVAGPQVFLIDGSTANTSTVTYASIPVTVTIQPGVVNTLGYTPHLHAQPVTQLLPVSPAVATPITSPTVPDFQVTIPAGVSILGWDGQPNTQIGVRAVPLDRLAIPPLPAGVETNVVYMFNFGKVGGGTPSQPIPVTAPNTLGAYPGQQVELWYFNEAPDGSAPNAWQMFGHGTVSSDGKLIVSNPGVGIPRFCCGAWTPRRPPPPPNTPGPETGPEPSPEKCPRCGGPIDLASGLVEVEATDFTLAGRLPLTLTRMYRTLDPTVGPFGVGWRHTYEVFVRAVSSDLALLLTPENLRPRFAKQPDGSFLNSDYPRFRGAKLTRNADNTWTLRFKEGTTWSFNSSGWLIAQRDRNGNQITIIRDSQNRVTSLSDPGGRTLSFSYSGSDLKVQQITDPLGRTVQYAYDASNRLIRVTDPAGGTWQYTYDAGGRLETITDPRGTITERNIYDSSGRVIQQVQADGGTFQISYQVVAGTVAAVTVTDPNGNRTSYRFGPGRVLTGATDALGQTTQTPRAAGSNLTASRTDGLGRETRYTYDGTGNVTSITDPLGQVRSFTYDPTFNQVLAATDPLGQVTSYSYDPQGNLAGITDPLGHTTTFSYNAVGQPMSVTDALGNISTFEYDSVGNLVATIDPLGNRTERTYDSVSRLIAVKDPKGAVTRFTYDPLGNLLTVTDAKGQITTHTYDPMNRLGSRTDALNRTESYTYDLNGNLKTVTDRKGQVTTHSYDASDHRIRTNFADGSSISYTYDPAGNLLGATDSLTGTITRSYDGLNRLVGELTPQGAITYAYDPLGRRQGMQVNGLAPVAYGYDAASRLTGVTQGPQSATLTHDPANRRTSLVLPNGITVSYIYDAASRLIGQTYAGPGGPLGDLTYAYDPNGNRLATGGSWARTGIPAAVPTSTYDEANEQLTFGDITQAFDPNGNLLTQTDASGTTTYTWDARNRLVGVSGPAVTASFTYDALGRRIQKVINGVTTSYLYDGLDIVREGGTNGDAAYLRTLTVDEALARTDANGSVTYLADALQSTVALTDAAGVPLTSYAYAPFGETSTSGAPSLNPFQFTGRENAGNRLYYYRARFYASSLNRFLSEDPAGSIGGPNFYAYVRNNPLKWADPLGLIEWPLDAPTPWNEGAHGLPGSPTHGNWCGRWYSGGRVHEVGPEPPIDSMDECCKRHDECYGERACAKSDARARISCDEQLLKCLSQLPENPREWPRPASNPRGAAIYRWGATLWFLFQSRI